MAEDSPGHGVGRPQAVSLAEGQTASALHLLLARGFAKRRSWLYGRLSRPTAATHPRARPSATGR